mmetsp:Transcript_40255/g.110735  ORF Transcript_40255/g.110735 Transcript_40255/m.110735 type:complete len:83 (-) Transcript_40255:21-269(-)
MVKAYLGAGQFTLHFQAAVAVDYRASPSFGTLRSTSLEQHLSGMTAGAVFGVSCHLPREVVLDIELFLPEIVGVMERISKQL